MGAVTRQDPEMSEIKGRISAVEGRVMACETQVQVIGERLSGHIDASVAHRETVAGKLSGLEAVAQGTQALLREQIEEARAEREAARRMAEAEAEHRRAMQTAAVAGRTDAIRAVMGHPAVASILSAIAVAIGAWAYTAGGVQQAPAPVGQAAAVGVMSAGVGPAGE